MALADLNYCIFKKPAFTQKLLTARWSNSSE